LIFRWDRRVSASGGRIRSAASNIPFTQRRTRSSGPPSGSGAQSANSSDGTLRIFHPSQVCSRRRVRRCFQRRGPACRSPIARPDLFSSGNRPSKGKFKMLKRTGDHESSVRLPGLPPVIDPCRSALIARRGRSCLGLCLSQGFGHHQGAFERARPRPDHQPPETASGPYPLMGLTANEMR